MARKAKLKYKELKGRLSLWSFRTRHMYSNLSASCNYKWWNADGYKEFINEEDVYNDWDLYKSIADKKVLGYYVEDGSIVQVTLEDDAA